MKLPWHSDKEKAAEEMAGRNYVSEAVVESRVVPGVRLTIAKMSFGRRVELMRRVRELARELTAAAATTETNA